MDETRLARQTIGLRIPLSWFDHIDDTSLDDSPSGEMAPWWVDDLRSRGKSSAIQGSGYAQLALAAVVMGDTNVVYPIQAAHRRQLLAAGALSTSSMLMRGLPFPCSETIGDVYTDHVAVMATVRYSELCFNCDMQRIQRADRMYKSLEMPLSVDKGYSGTLAELWGAEIDGVTGRVGFPMERRASLILASVLGLVHGTNRAGLQQLLGGWNFVFAFRRELACVLDVADVAAQRFPPRRVSHLDGALVDELLRAASLSPLSGANIRAPAADR